MERLLFRHEVVEFQQQHRHWGAVVVLQPVSTKFLSWFVMVAAALAATFACVAPYPRTETVTGYLAPAAGTAKVFAAQGGVIRQVHVRQGQDVHKGDPLLTLSTEQIGADGRSVQTEILDVLRSQKNLLSQQIGAEEARATSERQRLTDLLQGQATQIAAIQAQITTQRDRIKLAEDLVLSATSLHQKGYLSNLEYTRRLAGVLEQRQAMDQLNQQLVKLHGSVIETRASLDQLPATMGEKVQLLRNELASTEQRISERTVQAAYTIQAPVNGRISLLNVSDGQAADPKAVLMEVVPDNSVLEAQVFVPAKAIGFVAPGQRVRFLYDAFPYQAYGTYDGVITRVSRTMLTPTDMTGPLHLQEASYMAIASLERPDVDVHQQRVALQPDMTFKAKIVLEKRPLIRWLLNAIRGTGL